MSAGTFVRSRYAANYGAGTSIHPIRVQVETVGAAIGGTTNNPPVGAVNNPISARSSNGRRSLGLTPRFVTLQAPATGAPTGYQPGGTTRIPALTDTFFNAAATGVTCTYLGAAFIVVSRSPELTR